jgi:hypothetical protein
MGTRSGSRSHRTQRVRHRDETEQFVLYGPPASDGGIALLPARGFADTVVGMRAHDTDIAGRDSEDASRNERQAPSYPLSASKVSAARRRNLTEAILRARAA